MENPEKEKLILELQEKLAQAQEQALAASIRLQEKEAAQREMESLFKNLKEEQRSQQLYEQLRENLAKSQARIEELEKRLLEKAQGKVSESPLDRVFWEAKELDQKRREQMVQAEARIHVLEDQLRQMGNLENMMEQTQRQAQELQKMMLELLPQIKLQQAQRKELQIMLESSQKAKHYCAETSKTLRAEWEDMTKRLNDLEKEIIRFQTSKNRVEQLEQLLAYERELLERIKKSESKS